MLVYQKAYPLSMLWYYLATLEWSYVATLAMLAHGIPNYEPAI